MDACRSRRARRREYGKGCGGCDPAGLLASDGCRAVLLRAVVEADVVLERVELSCFVTVLALTGHRGAGVNRLSNGAPRWGIGCSDLPQGSSSAVPSLSSHVLRSLQSQGGKEPVARLWWRWGRVELPVQKDAQRGCTTGLSGVWLGGWVGPPAGRPATCREGLEWLAAASEPLHPRLYDASVSRRSGLAGRGYAFRQPVRLVRRQLMFCRLICE